MTTLKSILTLKECAEYTGYTMGTIYNFTSTRNIPHYKKGRRIFFDRDELEKWLKTDRVEMVEDKDTKAANYNFLKTAK